MLGESLGELEGEILGVSLGAVEGPTLGESLGDCEGAALGVHWATHLVYYWATLRD